LTSLTSRLAGWRSGLAAAPRVRILFWAMLIACLFYAIDLGAPIERGLHNVRDMVRSTPADGRIVVVEIDNSSLRTIPDWGSRRSLDAKLVDNLFELGARQVVFDKVYTDPSPSGDDGVFAAALKRHAGRVTLATRFEVNRTTKKREPLRPTPALVGVARLGSINVWRDFLGSTSGVPFSTKMGGKLYPSFASILSGRYSTRTDLFAPDYAIRADSVPTVNLTDVLARTPATRILKGRDVIIAKTADSLGDTHFVPGQGPIPGVYVHVIAAQTLRSNMPRDLGGMPALLFTLLACIAYVHATRSGARWLIGLGTLSVLLVAPLYLDAKHIAVQICPALLLGIIVAVRARILVRAGHNATTGLPTLVGARTENRTVPYTLVAMKIGNHADLRATMTRAQEKLLITEIARRLQVGEALELMHGDDLFVWRTAEPISPQLFDHVEGLHALLSSPVSVGGRLIDLAVGFGIENERDRPLMNRVGSVEVAASEAVSQGSKYRVHDPRRLEDATFRQSLLSQLDLALANGEIWVAYQPKLDLRGKRIIGAEALIRWSHPDRGMVPPDQFIPVAEQSNRIAGLTMFVLENAIRDMRRLDTFDPEFSIAVNLSVRMLGEPDLADEIAALLVKHALAPHRLVLEITENEEIDPNGIHLKTLYALRALGLHLSIDDYGTKFSTLDYIRQLPASEIKIDQRFIGNVHQDRNAWIMARSTVELAHSLGLKVVAEGVELPETLAALTEMDCDVAQGYLISRPIRFSDLERFISATKMRRVA